MKFKNSKSSPLKPPSRSRNVFTDIGYFLLHKPKNKTLIKFDSQEKRTEYNHRIMQRMGMDIEKNSILNIHKIGVDAPASYVFNELLNWNGDSTCWPNNIARVERQENRIEEIKILPFGWSKYPFGLKKSFFGFHFIPLFNLNSIRIKQSPDSFDFDNARYLLYKCSGGYPIGIFGMYVRSSISEMGEDNKTQLFFTVSFNFYGKELKRKKTIMSVLWEGVHNRVTANVLNRIKQLSEWRLDRITHNHEFL